MISPVARARRWGSRVYPRGRGPSDVARSDFVAPGPGHWQLDRSHHSGGTTTIAQRLMTVGIEVGGSDMFQSLGIPISSVVPAYVQGFLYVQMRSTFGGRVPVWMPPAPVIRRLFANSPLGRRCEATARQALADQPWRQSLARWPSRAKELIELNSRWQRFDLNEADDVALVEHIIALYDHCQDGFVEHFRLHGVDLVPIGMLLSQGARWGIGREALLETLTGASDATAVPQRALDRIAAAIARDFGTEFASGDVVTIDEIRQIDPAIAASVDAFLARYGSTVVEGYDIDGRTLAEIPDLVVQRILACSDRSAVTPSPPKSACELGLDVSLHDQFDELVREARRAVAVREEQGPLTIQWPVGLLRRALLEVGRRRVASQCWSDARLGLELRVEELCSLGSADEPGNDELESRRVARLSQRQLLPPRTLGSVETPDPNPDWFTPAVAAMVDLLLVTTTELGIRNVADSPAVSHGADDDRGPGPSQPGGDSDHREGSMLSGSGIGTAVVTGIARVAMSDDEAIGFAQPGEILITHATSPAYNLVLGQVGGLVTTSQGAMSHAAVLARELGFTAIVGVSNATQILRSGDRVRLDPAAGTVELLHAERL